ncbi:MAG: NAD-dependent epimerase/dehydratase family protein [Nostocales cyanobacterium W4_Combined_metabat2_030]|nr:NAD-dependent epimerase/dehydratase family protein [Nostocales cyanobacterium W4_Combined_metabat2_030]
MNRNFYGASKIACEAMCRAFYDRYGLNYVGLRYMNVYGPHQDQTAAYTGVIPIMLNKIDANEPPVINGDGSQAYDFIYVEDTCRTFANIADDFKPAGFGEQPDVYHSDAIFLMGIDSAQAISAFDPREGVDQVWPGDGVIYSQRLSAQRTKSRLNKIMASPYYKSMTIRNWNTTTRLLELLKEIDAD